MTTESGRRVRDRHRDHRPYQRPARLEDLRGPTGGIVELPVTICWAPDRRFDLARPDALAWAYSYVITEGTTAQQESLLNPELLRRSWPRLVLPRPCRELWESNFDDLVERH